MKVTARGRRVMGRLLASVALVGLAASASKAAEPATIVLVSNHADAAIIPLLRAELAHLGLNVLVVDRGDHELTPSELTEAARRNRAIAAFRVLVAQGKVEVWLADRVTGKVLLREVLKTQAKPTDTSESTVVARAVELLRASLLELDVDNRPAGEVQKPATLPKALAPPPRAPPVSPPPEPRNTGVALNTSFVLLAGSLSTRPAPGLGVAVRWQFMPNFSVVGRIAAPLAGPEYSMPEGHTQLTPRLATASAKWSSDSFSEGFHVGVESGIGLLWTRAVGVGTPGLYNGFVANDVEPVPFAGGELSYNATRNVAFALGLLGGPGLSPTKYVLTKENSTDEKVIGRYGRWMGLASVGLDVAWN
jgi:hypothetical protein